MKKLTKSILVMMMSLLAMISCTMFVTMNVKANQTANPLSSIAFNMTEGASVRVILKDDGSADKAQTGIRFQAKMSEADYKALPQDLDLVYGILVTTLENAKAYPITTGSVFGPKPVYTFDATDTSGAPKIVNVELDDLVPMDESKDGTVDYYYMQASMVNIKSNDKEFVGVAYLKSTNENDEYIYDVKSYDVANARSMAYVAQIEMENEDVDPRIKGALADTYLAGLSQDIEVAYSVKYDENRTMEDTITLNFPVGEPITTADVKTAFETAIVEEGFDVTNYTDGTHTLKVGGEDKTSAMIYANGKNVPAVTLNFTANKADDKVYSDIAGYYTTDGAGSVFLNADKSLVYNPDLGLTGTGVIEGCSYVLYADGVMSVTIGGNTSYGKYNAEDLKAILEINSVEHEYVSSVEAPASVYANLRGYYEDEGNTNYVVLNANGTLVKNLDKQGSYVVSYDKAAKGFVLTSAMLDGATESQVIDLSNVSVKVDGGVYALSTTKTLASEEDYKAFAKTYTGEISWSAMYGAGNLEEIKTKKYASTMGAAGDPEVKRELKYIFTEDGQLFHDGMQEHSGFKSNSTATGSGWNPIGLLQGAKNGSFILFERGEIIAKINEVVVLTNAEKTVKDVEATGSYSSTNKTLTLTIPGYRSWTNSFTLTQQEETSVESSLIDNGAYMTQLYADFTNGVAGAAATKTAYMLPTTFATGIGMAKPRFEFLPESNGTRKVQYLDSVHAPTTTWSLVPITETFGEVKLNYSLGSANEYWKMYYNYVNGVFVMRGSVSFFWDNIRVSPGYYHFFDMKPQTGWGYASYDTSIHELLGLPSMNRLVGEGTIETPATKTFENNVASITLENDGVGKIQNAQGYCAPQSGKATVNLGGEDKASTYSLVANSLTSGLIFIDLAETPSYQNERSLPENRYIQGEYNLVDGKYVITFNYKGQDFYLVDGGAGNVYKGKVSGTYACGNETLTLDIAKYGVEEVGGWSINAISANAGQITIDGESGTYAFENGTVKLVINGKVYVKAYGTIAELYAKYAGTYTATYNSTKTMSITLDASGNLTAVINGGTQKTGTYTFEIISGELSIVFDFELFNALGEIGVDSGYYSVKNAAQNNPDKLNAAGLPTQYRDTHLYNVYNYAIGTVNANGSFSVMFEGLSTSVINLVKQVAQA